MRRNKKANAGAIFIVIVSFAAMGALIFFYLNFSSQRQLLEHIPAGSYESAIFSAGANAEKALLYLDESAKMAFDKTVLEIGENGGFPNTLDYITESQNCGRYGYQLWNAKDKTCFPNIKENFGQQFDKNLKEKLSEYPYASFYVDYDYVLYNDTLNFTIIGKTDDRITFPISLGGEETEQVTCQVSVEKIDPAIDCQADNCFLNQEANAKLKETASNLESAGYSITITSAYRSYEEQKRMYDACKGQDCEKDVSKPDCKTSPHLTGGAIDIKVSKDGHPMDYGEMGIGYSYANYKKFTRENILVHKEIERLMCENDWVRFGYDDDKRTEIGEWWHFEYKTERWQKAQDLGIQEKRKVCAIV